MTKSELIACLAARHAALTLVDCKLALESILDNIGNSLASGDRVEIRGFGSFGIRVRPARIGRNPKTGERVEIPETHAPFFKPGRELRDSVNSKGSSEQRLAA